MYNRLSEGGTGRVAQLGEHLLCKQGVRGSNPLTSTNQFNGLVEASETTSASWCTFWCTPYSGPRNLDHPIS